MTKNKPNDALVVRDQAGTFYLLTPKMLTQARVADEQQAELRRQLDDDTTGFVIYANPFGWFAPVRVVEPPQELAELAGTRGGGLAVRRQLVGAEAGLLIRRRP